MSAKLVCLFGLIFSHSTAWSVFPTNGFIQTSAWFFSGTPFLSKLNPHIVNTLDGS